MSKFQEEIKQKTLDFLKMKRDRLINDELDLGAAHRILCGMGPQWVEIADGVLAAKNVARNEAEECLDEIIRLVRS